MEDKEKRRRERARRKKKYGKKNWQDRNSKEPLFIRRIEDMDDLGDFVFLEDEEDIDGLHYLTDRPETIETPFGKVIMLNTSTSPSGFDYESLQTYLGLVEEGKSTTYNYLDGALKALTIQHPHDVFFRYLYIQFHLDNFMYEDAYELTKEAVALFPKANLFKILLWYTQIITGQEIENPAVLEEDNIHNIFPKAKNFTGEEISIFYTLKGQVYIYDKNIEVAKQCLDILEEIDHTDAADLLQKKITVSSYNPWTIKIFLLALVGIVIGIIVFIIWLIVKFFSWIF